MHFSKMKFCSQILFDFAENSKYRTIPSDALNKAWLDWETKLITKRRMEKPNFGTIWPNDIENVLLLLLFLPCLSPRTVFGTSVQKLIQFHTVRFTIVSDNIKCYLDRRIILITNSDSRVNYSINLY